MNNIVTCRPVRRGLSPVWDNFFSDFNNYNYNYGYEDSYRKPVSDVIETEKIYKFELELPGFIEDELDVSVEKNVLTIKAEKKKAEKEEEKPDAFKKLISERVLNFTRKFILPENTETENIDAKYENGVLSLVLNKKEKELPRKIKIN
jgi:HSP20 family protein